MKSPKAIFVIPVTLFALAVASADSADKLPPRFSTVPVEQDASWAVEWWLPRHEEKKELAKGADIDLVFIGDSITHAWETDGAGVWQEYYAGRNAFNLGSSGDRTEHVLWRLENGAVDGMSPSLVVVMIGTNNTGHRMDPAAYTAEGIERIVDELRGRLPEAQVLVLAIFPRHVSPYNDMRKRNDEINALISKLDDGEAVHFLDIGANFVNADGTLRADIMPDLLHLNAEGYRIWAEAIEPSIGKLLQE